MPIVSSAYIADPAPQSGGGRWIVEMHTESTGAVHSMTYLWDGVADRDALLAAHANGLSHQLADDEAAAIIGES